MKIKNKCHSNQILSLLGKRIKHEIKISLLFFLSIASRPPSFPFSFWYLPSRWRQETKEGRKWPQAECVASSSNPANLPANFASICQGKSLLWVFSFLLILRFVLFPSPLRTKSTQQVLSRVARDSPSALLRKNQREIAAAVSYSSRSRSTSLAPIHHTQRTER